METVVFHNLLAHNKNMSLMKVWEANLVDSTGRKSIKRTYILEAELVTCEYNT